MNVEYTKYLRRFYDKLHSKTLIKYKKIRKNSIIVHFINIKSNDRLGLLNNSAIEKLRIPANVLCYLLERKFIRETDSVDSYVITAKGVWEIESKNNVMDQESLLEFIDDKLFDVYSESQKPLSEKHKLILFSMIAARAFSIESSVDLMRADRSKDAWKQIIDGSYGILNDFRVIKKLVVDDIYGKKGNEHPVSNVFRHTDKVPKRTKGLFKAAGNQRYYLDLYDGVQISGENLGFLLTRIFGKEHFEIDEINKISEFCNRVAYTQDIYIFDVKKHKFSNPRYDNVLRDALLKL